MKKKYENMLNSLINHIEYYLHDNDPCYLVLEEKALLDVALTKMYENDIPDNEELVEILKENNQARRIYSTLQAHPFKNYRL